MDFVAENFTRIISLENGRKIFDGDVAALFREQSLLEKSGLQAPQVIQLCNGLGINWVVLSPEECLAKIEEQWREKGD